MKMIKLWRLARAYRRAWMCRYVAVVTMRHRPNDVSEEAIVEARHNVDVTHNLMREARRALLSYLQDPEK